MVLEPVCCPQCHTPDVVKHGKSDDSKQRYRCRNLACSRASFIRDYTYRGDRPEVERQISNMAMNGSSIRDTARVLKVSPTTAIEELTKHRHLETVNRAVLEQTPTPPTTAVIVRVAEAEMDEMCSFVQSKQQQRWLWHASDHQTEAVLAYILALHDDAALSALMSLLAPFGIQQVYTDRWGAYLRLIEPEQHTVGKTSTQRIEQKHLTLRPRIKRLARKTICFSQSVLMHDTVIGMCINRYAFGRPV